MNSRRTLTQGQKRDIVHRQSGICPECGEKLNLARQEVEYDHRIPLAISNDNSLDNFDCLHMPCHKKKTKRDRRDIAKTERIRAKHLGTKAPSRNTIPGSRNSKFQRKVGGKTILRPTKGNRGEIYGR